MKHNLKVYILTIISVSIITLNSCKKSEQTLSEHLSVETKIAKQLNQSINETKDLKVKATLEEIKNSLDYATITKITNGDYLIKATKSIGKKVHSNSTSFIEFNENASQKINLLSSSNSDLLQLTDYLNNKKTNFTGTIEYNNLNGNLKNGIKIVNDIIIEKSAIQIKSKAISNQNGGEDLSLPPVPGDVVCTDWYWTTWYEENGFIVIVSQSFAFTTCTDDGGGGGDGNGSGVNAFTQADFDNYVSSFFPTNFIGNSSTQNSENLAEGYWTVIQHSYNTWRVTAKYRVKWKHDYYPQIYPPSARHEITYTEHAIQSTQYSGSNTFVNTTWAETSKSSTSNGNGTYQANVTQRVDGVIKHKSKYPPVGPLSFEFENAVGNMCVISPSLVLIEE